MSFLRPLVISALLLPMAACSPDEEPESTEIGKLEQPLNAAERRERATAIRDVSAASGLVNGPLLGGVAEVETGLAHCWSEAQWACQGPDSPSCGGGPVIAGASDGPCSIMQGGLGMFQFDAGTFSQTLERDGEDILLLEGNIEKAVEFIAQRIIEEVDGVETFQDAIDWLNSASPELGNERFEEWAAIMGCRYNGCCSSSTRCDNQRRKYRDAAIDLANEFEPEFWNASAGGCEAIPSEGRVIDDDDLCAFAGGDPRFWRREDTGFGSASRWTYTTDLEDEANFAEWRLSFESAGEYNIAVYRNAEKTLKSSQAMYRLSHGRGDSAVLIDQNGEEGFVSLGSYRFEAGEEYVLRVGDNTGEPNENDVRLYFDAIRISAQESPPIDIDEGGGGGGCQSGGRQSAPMWILFALGLFFSRVRRGLSEET